MAREPFLPPAVAEALTRRDTGRAAAGELVLGPVLRIDFRAADVPRSVQHGCGTVPDGFLVARATGAVFQVGWSDWSAELATLQAPVATTIVEGCFFTWAAPTTPTAV